MARRPAALRHYMTHDIRRVQVMDILRARDARQAMQHSLIARHHTPVISFTMNIAGDVKYDAAIHRAFNEGKQQILHEISRNGWETLDCAESIAFTGCEAQWAVRADAAQIKRCMMRIENATPLGRLFDIDVIDASGAHLSRGEERPCLICSGPVRVCARSRAHDARALFDKAQQIIKAHFDAQFIRRIGESAQRALMHEALTTPKPGLVDCENAGAHKDMDLFSFADSACALRPYFESCVRLGMENASPDQLQYEGILAEQTMFSAAHANTHKGAVFSLGILCYACGSCGENASLDAILHAAAAMGAHFLQQMKQSAQSRTGGEQQYIAHGLTGARGEAASGFSSVQQYALPALRAALSAGKTLPQAGLHALMTLIANVFDSNIIRRAGLDGQAWAMEQARHALQSNCDETCLRDMNTLFTQKNISPGGSADLLAVTYFLYFITKEC